VSAQLVVALDFPSPGEAEALVDTLYELDPIFKIGLESLFGYGDRLFAYLEARDVRHFIDAKVHDIPRTAAACIAQLVRHGTHIVNVHALGGVEMMRASVEAAQRRAAEIAAAAPYVFAVTILTSMSPQEVAEVGLSGTPEQNATHLARLASQAGCAGVVCSAQEVQAIKTALGPAFLTLTPGIRPSGSESGDQQRVTTPAQAVRVGSDYLVVGRPITQARDPLAAAKAILDEMREASG
jgi:orotidine-5'-phosphate decarboxylase